MTSKYAPGPASGARIHKDGEEWTLVVVRELAHPVERVWEAITAPEHLREWAPFDADRNLASVGAATLTTVNTPAPQVSASRVTRVEALKLLQLDWGGQQMRWELEALAGNRTRLTLWHGIDRRYIAMGAAGWHVCLDVLERSLGGQPIGRLAGPVVMKLEGWQRLHRDYAKQLGVEGAGGAEP